MLIVAMAAPGTGGAAVAARVGALPESLDAATQALVVEPSDAGVPSARDAYEVTTKAELLRQRYTLTYSTTWTGAIRWPFPTTVPITDGFGSRAAPCAGCSTYHTALDFAPGAGEPIYAIADGVVREHVDGNGSWGNYVIIEHQIDGQTVVSSYAHMQRGSSPLQAGDTISVGDYIGLVGATGQVTGNHLHLEIDVNGVSVDPFAWLTENAG